MPNINADQLSAEIKEQLSKYSVKLTPLVNEKLKAVAKEAADTLKQGGSYKERTGKYTKDWAVKEDKSSSVLVTNDYTVYNRKHYQLTHLLEKGHATRGGGRAKAYPHIAPVNEEVQIKALEKVKEAIREAGE